MHDGVRRVRVWCAGMAVAAVAVAGVGCGDGDASGEQQRKYQAANEPPAAFVSRLAKTLETARTKKDCAEVYEINGRSLTRLPCPAGAQLRRSMARFKIVGAKAYGTGAVIDYTSGRSKDGAAIVLIVAPNRRWGLSRFGVLTEPSAGTSDAASRAGYRKALDAYLAAIRARDCKAYIKVRVTDGRSERQVCETIFRGTKVLLDRMNADPGAAPRYQGGSSVYGFFTLETSKPTPLNMTFSMVKADAGSATPYAVLDAGPSPTAKQQREAIRRYERSKARKSSTDLDMSPSSKAE